MAFIDNFSDLMNKTASVYSKTTVPDGKGGITYTYTLRSSAKCALWQRSAAEQYLSSKISNTSSWIMACKPNSAFAESDRITIDSINYKISKPDDIMFEDDIMIIGLEVVQ